MNMPEIIESDDLVLEIPLFPSEELAREIYDEVIDSLDILKPWLPWAKDGYSLQNEMNFLTNYCLEHWNQKTGFAYLIRDKKSHEFCGVVDIVRVDIENKVGEIGYWLSKKSQGKGYMNKAVLALEKEAFANGLNRMEIRNDTQNLRSANVAKRSGYHLDGVLRQDKWSDYFKRYIDTNVWSKLKSDLK